MTPPPPLADTHCISCRAWFDDSKELNKHVEETGHSKRCGQCDESFKNNLELHTHVRLHHPPPFSCPDSSTDFAEWGFYELHASEDHAEDTGIFFMCRSCPDEYIGSMCALQAHVRWCQAPTSQCASCPEYFWCENDLEAHVRMHHYLRRCNQCPRVFSNSKSYQDHEKTHPALFICITCNKEFWDGNIFRRHLESLNHVHQCEKCTTKIGSQKALKTHNAKCHSARFECVSCNDTFSKAEALAQHSKETQHWRGCQNCDEKFADQALYDKHRATPHDPNFVCNSCDRNSTVLRLASSTRMLRGTRGCTVTIVADTLPI